MLALLISTSELLEYFVRKQKLGTTYLKELFKWKLPREG